MSLTQKELLALHAIERDLATRYPDLHVRLDLLEETPHAAPAGEAVPRRPRSGVRLFVAILALVMLAVVGWTLPGNGYCPGGTHPAGPAATAAMAAACGDGEAAVEDDTGGGAGTDRA